MTLALRLLPLLSDAYSLAVRSGLMDLWWFRRLYRGAYFSYKRHLEDPFEGLVERRPGLFSGGHILDVGAHIGYTSSLFLRALTPGFRVYSFEPDPVNFSILEDTVRRLRASGFMVPIHAAVGDVMGEVELWRNPRHPGDHRLATRAFRRWAGPEVRETLRVPLLSLDGFLRNEDPQLPVSFVKVDVQGFEPAVCSGMEELLERSPRASVAIEFAPRELESQGFEPTLLPEFFRSRGYSVCVLAKDGTSTPVSRDGILGCDGGRGYVDLLMVRE